MEKNREREGLRAEFNHGKLTRLPFSLPLPLSPPSSLRPFLFHPSYVRFAGEFQARVILVIGYRGCRISEDCFWIYLRNFYLADFIRYATAFRDQSAQRYFCLQSPFIFLNRRHFAASVIWIDLAVRVRQNTLAKWYPANFAEHYNSLSSCIVIATLFHSILIIPAFTANRHQCRQFDPDNVKNEQVQREI